MNQSGFLGFATLITLLWIDGGDCCSDGGSTPTTTPLDPGQICYEGDGKEYRGDLAATISGRICQPWKNNWGEWIPSSYPELTSNHCRNPSGGTGPWCYWKEAYGSDGWDYCGLPKCSDFLLVLLADFIRHRDKTLLYNKFPSQPASGLHWRSRFSLEECLRDCVENRVGDAAGCRAVVFDYRSAQGCWLLPKNFEHYYRVNALSDNPRFDFYDKKDVDPARRQPPPDARDVRGFDRKPNLGSYDAGGVTQPRMSLEECGHACEESGTLGGKDCYAFQFNHARGQGCYLFTENDYKRSAFTRSNDYDVYEKQGWAVVSRS